MDATKPIHRHRDFGDEHRDQCVRESNGHFRITVTGPIAIRNAHDYACSSDLFTAAHIYAHGDDASAAHPGHR